MKLSLSKTIFIFILLMSSTVAIAHHSFSATFDENKTITVEGVVTKFTFRNPHVLVYFDIVDEDGNTVNWMSEGGAATLMRRAGWSKDIIKAGDVVRVTGNTTHDGSAMVSIETIQLISALGGEVVKDITRTTDRGPDQGGGGPRQQEEIVKAAPMPVELENGLPNLSGAWTPGPITVWDWGVRRR